MSQKLAPLLTYHFTIRALTAKHRAAIVISTTGIYEGVPEDSVSVSSSPAIPIIMLHAIKIAIPMIYFMEGASLNQT